MVKTSHSLLKPDYSYCSTETHTEGLKEIQISNCRGSERNREARAVRADREQRTEQSLPASKDWDFQLRSSC
ncbi:hypothetical protein PBY51_000105 [Eleginops maclovinus]|nr:hypothetical protein PBY51_000105 [Eleginops maclovinus]